MTGRVAFALLWLFVFTIPWEKSVFLPGIGTLSRLLGGLALLAGLVVTIQHRQFRFPNLALLAASLFTAWSAATFFWSYDPSATLTRASTLIQLFLMIWIVWLLCRTASQQHGLLAAYAAGSVVASVAAIARYELQQQTYYRRYSAPGFDPNDFGVTVALAVPVTLYLAGNSRWHAAWLWRACVAVQCAAILLSASRTALIATVAGFGFLLWSWRSSSIAQRSSGLLLLALLGAGAVSLAPKESRQRIATIGEEVSRGTLHKRTTIWKAGMQAWRSRKLQGTGAGAYPDAVRPLIGIPPIPGHEYVAHNTLLSVLVETGVAGLSLFGGFLAILALYVVVMQGKDQALWGTVLLVWSIGAFTLTWEHRKAGWILFALLITAWARAFRTENG